MNDHMICRCEDVTATEVRAAIDAGACNAQEVKMRTRAGMGPCQGRVCRPAVEAMVGVTDEGVLRSNSAMTVHLPVRPVSLQDLVIEREQ
ncbi:(2Fe-2S)-binding protein [Cryobacterium tagatosivorans]|uniref:(2Fe-2S)-binding protein n=1 Tax=Cryobacterium tagatosivorans TaxID=1259199 RepID=A0A4V3I6T4_9MICO|nr:(2Fe-2S)-binding protein [Cryobacterium tagatosivorans]TFB55172.1 (2Fe-2S)-binding protein [Cryobacterium tagatosivorans]